GLVDEVVSRIIFMPEYRNHDAVRGLEAFSHLWLVWVFSDGFSHRRQADTAADGAGGVEMADAAAGTEAGRAGGAGMADAAAGTEAGRAANQRRWSPTVRPPRLGGNERLGVWATRSPNRPNPIGLSCVEIVSVEPDTPDGPVITVRGADLLDGTPILDIKPYIAYADAKPDASCSYASAAPDTGILSVEGAELLPSDINKEAVIAVLSGDPRPSYQDDPTRIYGIRFGSYDIRFRITDGVATILEVR
ncbi:MAG: TrmO family methyltransferase, partial [Eubacterium sp.]|nr:TrmO family methyltransferase [Eubacterium sp.]